MIKNLIPRKHPRRTRAWIVWALLIWLGPLLPLSAAELELLSVRDARLPHSSGGNGDSVAPRVSPDGRFVLFASTANNLVTNDDAHFGTDVFLHDRETGTTTLVSVNTNGTGGGDGHSLPGMVSTNGRFVVFESTSLNLVPFKTLTHADVFLRDMEAGVTRLVSRQADGPGSDRTSRGPVISADAAWVAFVSRATNLVSVDSNTPITWTPHVFLHNVAVGTSERLGPAEMRFPTNINFDLRIGGDEPSFSADGRKLLFLSNATNLVDGVPVSRGELYLLDLATREWTWASEGAADRVFTDTNRLAAVSSKGALSADGRWLTFRTALANAPTNGVIFHRDLLAAAPVMVTSNSLPPSVAADDLYAPRLSADGRFVAYVEAIATPGSGSVVRRWDAQTETSVTVSGDETAEGIRSTSPAISADGRFVAHLSTATDLATPVLSSGLSLYRHDLSNGEVQVTRLGPAEGLRPEFGLSADGQLAVFHSREALSGTTADGQENVFVQSADDPLPRLVSQRHETLTNTPPDNLGIFSGHMSVSVDGRWVAFASHADHLVPGDDNDQMDVFVFDRARGRVRLASVGLDGHPAKGGSSHTPAISGDGRYVAFLSTATNLVADTHSPHFHLFRHDLLTGGTELVSVSTNGVTPFQQDVTDPSISHDGRHLAYASRLPMLSPRQALHAHWRDMETNRAVTLGTNGTLQAQLQPHPPSMSTNGLEVAYLSGTTLRIWHALGQTNRNFGSGSVRPIISPDGGRLLVQAANGISSINLRAAGSQSINVTGIMSVRGQHHWNGEGSHFLIAIRSSLVAADLNNTNDVYLCSATSADRVLLSRNLTGTGAGNGPSDSPAFSADGRFVVFRTWATDIVPVSGPGPHLVLHDVESGTNRLITPARTDNNSRGHLIRPILSGAGETVLFSGWRPDLDTGRSLSPLAVAFSPLDEDRDGLLDDWERHHFKGLAKDGTEDSDLDGMTDLEEYLAGTDPNDKNSVLRVVAERHQEGPVEMLLFRWPAGREAVSRLEFTGNLSEPLWRDVPGARRWADGWLEQWLEDPETSTNGFFKVRLEE